MRKWVSILLIIRMKDNGIEDGEGRIKYMEYVIFLYNYMEYVIFLYS